MTLEKVEAKLLPLGFVKIPNEPEDGIEILGTYGFNYCSHCKRGDCIISIFRQEEDTSLDCLEYQIITENMSGSDYLTAASLNYELRELGIKKPKKV